VATEISGRKAGLVEGSPRRTRVQGKPQPLSSTGAIASYCSPLIGSGKSGAKIHTSETRSGQDTRGKEAQAIHASRKNHQAETIPTIEKEALTRHASRTSPNMSVTLELSMA
jgi:hypothetical protein